MEKNFSRTCDHRGASGVGVLVNTRWAVSINLFERLITRIERLWLKRWELITSLTFFVTYALAFSYDKDEVDTFYFVLKFYGEGYTFF
ncbi:unnamed protein product [Angiostrongylus costaricensis]|uniref:Bestrophin homolog n=1 Tax=Angiostrongylus costaricensis TaxID=334426 RepID=A0A0R3PVU0_ANGCS|nr:unnamed protein product [Angiostrongylus costaricensis]